MKPGEQVEIILDPTFENWLKRLRDPVGRRAVNQRLARLQVGNFGDSKPVGEAVWEIRIDAGPGYRLYFTRVGDRVILLLCGGDKSSQAKDIALAKSLAAKFKENQSGGRL